MDGISRSPLPFMIRKGLRRYQGVRPKLDPRNLLISRHPTGSTALKSQLADGHPPPDRPMFFPWATHAPREEPDE